MVSYSLLYERGKIYRVIFWFNRMGSHTFFIFRPGFIIWLEIFHGGLYPLVC